MRILVVILSMGLACLIIGCSAISIIAFGSKEYFQDPPTIVSKDNLFFLRWKYANNPKLLFAMYSDSKIKNDSLIFTIAATTSSGKQNGILHFEEIKNPMKIHLIVQNKAFWKNPDGSLNNLVLQTMSSGEFSSIRNLDLRKTH